MQHVRGPTVLDWRACLVPLEENLHWLKMTKGIFGVYRFKGLSKG